MARANVLDRAIAALTEKIEALQSAKQVLLDTRDEAARRPRPRTAILTEQTPEEVIEIDENGVVHAVVAPGRRRRAC